MKNRKLIFLMLVMAFFLSGNVFSQTPPPSIVLLSYAIKGNMATDKTITLQLSIANTNRYLDATNVLFSYTSANDVFLPAPGLSNQFYIPVIAAGSKITYDLELAVYNPQPESTLFLDFDVSFSDRINGITINHFIISDHVKSSNAVQLIGIETLSENKLENDRSIVVFKATVLNHSNFLVRNLSMVLKGENPAFTITVPLDDMSPGQHLSHEFNLTLLSDDLPDFSVTFNYMDINDAKHTSDPQKIKVYSNITQDIETQMQFIFRIVAMVLLFLVLSAGIYVFLRNYQNRKRYY